MKPRSHRRAGYTILEIMVVVMLFVVVATKVSSFLIAAPRVASQQSVETVLQDRARALMDRVVMAVMASDRDSLNPFETPFYTTEITYRVSLGVDADGEVVWQEPERIALDGEGRQITWRRNPGELNETRVVWTNLVRDLMQGESFNGVDDNGNGFSDEEGLNFIIDGNSVLIQLTLSRVGSDGERAVFTLESRATCRN